MSTARTQALKVGAMVSVALVLLMVALFFIGKGQNFWQRKVRYEIHFSRTNGLLFGAPVALNGVNIGSVVRISFPPDPEARYIDVGIEVRREIAQRIREDTEASIRTQGVLGDKYVELSTGTPTAPAREPGSVIPAINPIDYEVMLGQSGDIVDNIVELTASLRNVLQAIDEGEGLLGAIVRSREEGELTFADIQDAVANLAEITARIEAITESVERGEGLLGALVRDTARAEGILSRLTRSAENLDQFTQRLNRTDGVLQRLIADKELGDRLVGNVDAATQDLAEITAKVKRGEGTLGALVNDSALYDETTELVRSTRKSWLLALFRSVRGLWPFEGKPKAIKSGEAPGEEGNRLTEVENGGEVQAREQPDRHAEQISGTSAPDPLAIDPPKPTH
jgi:phospholipid/cholesterol/gamma-HCH transport system substrate-binding protein